MRVSEGEVRRGQASGWEGGREGGGRHSSNRESAKEKRGKDGQGRDSDRVRVSETEVQDNGNRRGPSCSPPRHLSFCLTIPGYDNGMMPF